MELSWPQPHLQHNLVEGQSFSNHRVCQIQKVSVHETRRQQRLTTHLTKGRRYEVPHETNTRASLYLVEEGFFRKGVESSIWGRLYSVQSAVPRGARCHCHTKLRFVYHAVPVKCSRSCVGASCSGKRGCNRKVHGQRWWSVAVSKLVLVEYRAKSRGTSSHEAQVHEAAGNARVVSRLTSMWVKAPTTKSSLPYLAYSMKTKLS